MVGGGWWLWMGICDLDLDVGISHGGWWVVVMDGFNHRFKDASTRVRPQSEIVNALRLLMRGAY
jgi:hypothetical protein